MTATWLVLALMVATGAAVRAQDLAVSGRPAVAADKPTVLYFVLHAHVDPTLPTFPLSADGQSRAEALARTVKAVPFTHVFSSHTTRARQMVERVAERRNLAVRQLPAPGTSVDGATVSDRTRSQLAIAPLVTALRQLPVGSTALVGLNSDNVYAVLNGLGVPAATAEQPCAAGTTCVPCLTNACITNSFDQLWILILERRSGKPTLIELRYGAPFSK